MILSGLFSVTCISLAVCPYNINSLRTRTVSSNSLFSTEDSICRLTTKEMELLCEINYVIQKEGYFLNFYFCHVSFLASYFVLFLNCFILFSESLFASLRQGSLYVAMAGLELIDPCLPLLP